MEKVAQYLQSEAVNRTCQVERDLFGRSAFNRYYYAMYLEVRSSVAKLRPEWANSKHATLPELFRGAIKKSLSQGSKKARRIGDNDLVNLCERAISMSENLANLMEKGYATRVSADYYPDLPISFLGAREFQLNTVDIKDAKSWPSKARSFLATITDAWKQLHD